MANDAEAIDLMKRIAELEATIERMHPVVGAAIAMRHVHEGCVTDPPCGSCTRCGFDHVVDAYRSAPPAAPVREFCPCSKKPCVCDRTREMIARAAPVAGDAAELLQSANLGRVSNMSAQCERCPRTVVVAMTHAGPVLCAACIDDAPVHPMAEEGSGPTCGPVAGRDYDWRCDTCGHQYVCEACGDERSSMPERSRFEAEVEARVVEEIAAWLEVRGQHLLRMAADDVRAGEWRTK